MEEKLSNIKEQGIERMRNMKKVLKEILTKTTKPGYDMKPLRDIASGDPIFGVVSNKNAASKHRSVRTF